MPALKFPDKLVLNQWIVSLFGIDTLAEHRDGGSKVRPMQLLAKQLRDRLAIRLVVRSVKIITNKPFGLSLSKANIGAEIAVRQAHRER